MPQHLDPNYRREPTETQPCAICHQPRRCRRVRKPKREGDKIIYVFMWLCTECVYNVEIA